MSEAPNNAERERLEEARLGTADWRLWGPYLAERAWGTVREDYSPDGTAWEYFTHDQARARAYRRSEDGLGGICDREQRLCFALALWNGRDAYLKERAFGLTGHQGNRGEDVKESYFYLDALPAASYLRYLYKYPQAPFPYDALIAENARRSREDPPFQLADTGCFDAQRYWDVDVFYAKAGPREIHIRIYLKNRGSDAAEIHLLPTLRFRSRPMTERSKEHAITFVGIDLAKRSFHVHAADAEAIREAVQRPNMRFVAIKSVEQQDIQAIQRMRSLVAGQRTALINQTRGLLLGYGLEVARGRAALQRRLLEILDDNDNGLGGRFRTELQGLYEQLQHLNARVAQNDAQLDRIAKDKAQAQAPMQLPGVGANGATTLLAAVGEDPACSRMAGEWRPGSVRCRADTPPAAKTACLESASAGMSTCANCSSAAPARCCAWPSARTIRRAAERRCMNVAVKEAIVGLVEALGFRIETDRNDPTIGLASKAS